jgi:hypothetical protein
LIENEMQIETKERRNMDCFPQDFAYGQLEVIGSFESDLRRIRMDIYDIITSDYQARKKYSMLRLNHSGQHKHVLGELAR